MTHTPLLQKLSFAAAIALTTFAVSATRPASAQQSSAAAPTKPVTVEWVYRVKYGSKDEWWQMFKKNQISVLENQKQLGFLKEYTVYAPSLHTSEDAR